MPAHPERMPAHPERMPAKYLARICAFSLLAPGALSQMSPIEDARPLVSSGGHTISWWEGGPALLASSSSMIRLNSRGIYSHGPGVAVRSLQEIGWYSKPCNLSAWALCATEVGSILPCGKPWMPDAPGLLPPGWSSLQCADSSAKVLTDLGAYDISACDIIDEGLDVVFSHGSVYIRNSALNPVLYWTLVVLGIVLVRSLSYNIQSMWMSEAGSKTQWPAVASVLAVFVIALLDQDTMYATESDKDFFWLSVIYVGLYLAFHLACWYMRAKARGSMEFQWPVYNMIIGALQLGVLRLYLSAYTPYTLFLLGAIGSRWWLKMLRTDPRHQFTMLLDACYVAMSMQVAAEGQAYALIPVVCISFVLADLANTLMDA